MPKPLKHPDKEAAPPPARQVAALCCRNGRKGVRILLITSRDSGRWVLPKGWPMDGKSDLEAAIQEAWEEAGVRVSAASADPLGMYSYDKRLDDGCEIPVRVALYRVEVSALSDRFPERAERDRRWVNPKKAARLVEEPELKTLLRKLVD